MPQDYSGQNLQGRNFTGQDLTGANFYKANLQGCNFKAANLLGANFSDADIRSADFSNAFLEGTNFTRANAGLSRKWVVVLLGTLCLMQVAVAVAFGTGGFLIVSILNPELVDYFLVPGAMILILVALIGIVLIQQADKIAQETNWDINQSRILAVNTSLLFLILGILLFITAIIMAYYHKLNVFIILFISGGFICGLAFIFALGVAGAIVVAGRLGFAGILAGLPAILGSIAWNYYTPQEFKVILISGTISLALTGTFIIYKTLFSKSKFLYFFRLSIISFAAFKGTIFIGAELTGANFSFSNLKHTDFRRANLNYTYWYESQQLELARIERTILEDLTVRELLISRKGYHKSYIRTNLREANLESIDLRYANFKEADLSYVNLQGADLEGANLSQVQAIGTDFTNAKMTDACVEAWNIGSNTKLDNVDCRWIYHLEYPKPGTDDRERRPSSGEFAPGEFTKLFQEVLTTVDLIFRNGVDWKAFISAFQKVKTENEDTKLTIQSIENKGVVVVRISVPPDTNKEKIHREFTQSYELALKVIEEKYQGIIAGKEGQIEIYRQQLEYERQRQKEQNADLKEIISMISSKPANVPVNVQEVEAIAEGQLRNNNLIILTLGDGDFQNGFSSVSAQVWINGERLPTQHTGQLPPASQLVKTYHSWQSLYKLFIEPLPIRLEKDKAQVTNISIVEVNKLAENLEEELNKWLNAEQFVKNVDRILREKFIRSDQIQVIIPSDNTDVRRLPWHLWDFFKSYRKAEVALSLPFYDRALRTALTRNQIRILSILGDDKGINLDKERQLLAQIDAETTLIVKPNCQQLHEQLWSEQGWDILCFSGHSSSEMDGRNGWIYINDKDKLTIPELKNALTTAIARGLQIAIFNSCDGLGLANQLASLHIPQIIVMREPVPDVVAQEFLKNFLTAFASGKSFYLAVREAREKLQGLEDRFPCASLLPVICQNPAEIPPTWESFINRQETCSSDT